MAYTEAQLLEDCARLHAKQQHHLSKEQYQAVWGALVTSIAAQFALYKGAHIPSFARLTWKRAPGQHMRPSLVLTERFATEHNLTTRGCGAGTFPCRDLDVNNPNFRCGGAVEGERVSVAVAELVEQLGAALGSGQQVRINMGVGTLRAQNNNVDFDFDKVWRKNLHDGEATPATPASNFSWGSRPESRAQSVADSSSGSSCPSCATSTCSATHHRRRRPRRHRATPEEQREREKLSPMQEQTPGSPARLASPSRAPSPSKEAPHHHCHCHHHHRHRSRHNGSPTQSGRSKPSSPNKERPRGLSPLEPLLDSGPIVQGTTPTTEFQYAQGGPSRLPSRQAPETKSPHSRPASQAALHPESHPSRVPSPLRCRSPDKWRPATATMPLPIVALGLEEGPNSLPAGTTAGADSSSSRRSPRKREQAASTEKLASAEKGPPTAQMRRPSTAAVILCRPPGADPVHLTTSTSLPAAAFPSSSLPPSRDSLSKHLSVYFDKGIATLERLVDKSKCVSSLEHTRRAAYERFHADLAERQKADQKVLVEMEARRKVLEARAQELVEAKKQQGRDLQVYLRAQMEEKAVREKEQRRAEKQLGPLTLARAIPWEPEGSKAELHGRKLHYGHHLREQMAERVDRKRAEVLQEREQQAVLLEGAAASLRRERFEQLERKKQEQRFFFHTWAIQRKEREKMLNASSGPMHPLPPECSIKSQTVAQVPS